ncbi:CD151 antigen [Plecturocebus cupreus]
MAVGIWTLALKSDYISLLASGTYLATAYILVVAGAVVMVTGVLGCCATFKERRNLLRLVSGVEATGRGAWMGPKGALNLCLAVLTWPGLGWGTVLPHLPSPMGPHIPAGPAEGSHQLRKQASGSVAAPQPPPGAWAAGWALCSEYFILLLIIFLLEIIAGILAYAYYQQVRGRAGRSETDTHRWGTHTQINMRD